MRYAVLTGLRDRLKSDGAVAGFFAARYPGRQPSFLIGLKPDVENGTAIPADRFPYVAVSPLAGETPARPSKDHTARISIMFGVHDDQIENDESLGLAAVLELSELIQSALDAQPIAPSLVWEGESSFSSDEGIGTPYFEGALIITVQVRA